MFNKVGVMFAQRSFLDVREIKFISWGPQGIRATVIEQHDCRPAKLYTYGMN